MTDSDLLPSLMQENLSILHSLSLSKDEQIAIFTLCALLPIPRHSTLSRPPERSTEKSENPKGGRVFLHLAPSSPGAHAQENVGGFQGSQEASEEESTQGCEGVVKSPKGQVVRDSGSIQSSNGLGFSLALKELIGANDVSLRFPLSKADFTGLSSPTLEDEVPSSGPGRQSKRRRFDEGKSLSIIEMHLSINEMFQVAVVIIAGTQTYYVGPLAGDLPNPGERSKWHPAVSTLAK